jgi:hypothetical protein
MAQLTNNEKSPFTDVVRLTFQDMITNSVALLAGTYKIAQIPASGGVDLVAVARPVAFTNATTINISGVGTTSETPTEYIAASTSIGGTGAFTPVANTGSLFVQTAGTTTVEAGSLPVSLSATAVPIYLKLSAVPTSTEKTGELVIGFRIIDLGRFLNA